MQWVRGLSLLFGLAEAWNVRQDTTGVELERQQMANSGWTGLRPWSYHVVGGEMMHLKEGSNVIRYGCVGSGFEVK